MRDMIIYERKSMDEILNDDNFFYLFEQKLFDL